MFDPTYPVPQSRQEALIPIAYWAMGQPDLTIALHRLNMDILEYILQLQKDQQEIESQNAADAMRRLREAF